MKKFILATLLLGIQGSVFASPLQDQFSQALSVVASSTIPVAQAQYPVQMPSMDGGYSLGAAYNSGAVQQGIKQKVNSEAQALLLEVSDIVADLSYTLIQGTRNPSETLRQQACDTVEQGMEKRRFAPFYAGYRELHVEFKEYVNQFGAISDILRCGA